MSKKEDLTNKIFGEWKVIKWDEEKTLEKKKNYWFCEKVSDPTIQKSMRQDVIKNYGSSHWKPYEPKTNICGKCGKEFIPKKMGQTRKFCFECVPDGTCTTGAQMRKQIKKWAVEYKGGKCEKCGYNKCIKALDFHHTDPTQKDFSISDRSLKLDWKDIKKELDKCKLLCSNCHREEHSKRKESDD